MPSTKLLILSTVLSAALAVPNVTVVPTTGGCAAYPGYDASSGIAGPWTIVVNQCDNSSIENFGDNSQVYRKAGDTGIHQGVITIASVNDQAKNPLRCNARTGALEAYTATGVSGYAWNQVNITEYPYNAQLMWGLGQSGTPVEAYHHYVDGVQQPGLFLGQANVTTWGIKKYPADSATTLDNEPYWGFRLLGPKSSIPWLNGSALFPDEYRTFIKVYGSD
ncbi:hypothetical protein PVAG01_10027 [Phlyctema vagabunda]|uniref:Uncharacterized protein n=1 Tax=Phlyctema vagabunda TaxID=108571 RepID=A0ABR4P5E0_9HELO